jgi:hypothetical protein
LPAQSLVTVGLSYSGQYGRRATDRAIMSKVDVGFWLALFACKTQHVGFWPFGGNALCGAEVRYG